MDKEWFWSYELRIDSSTSLCSGTQMKVAIYLSVQCVIDKNILEMMKLEVKATKMVYYVKNLLISDKNKRRKIRS